MPDACTCHEGFTWRRLTDPDCRFCEFKDSIAMAKDVRRSVGPPDNPWIRPTDQLPEPGQKTLIITVDHNVYVSQFELRKVEGNNTVPYGWTGPGPFQFFGQWVEFWMPVPEKP